MNQISIIVPIYNTKKYLNRCLDSIIEQSYKNIEIILIDDGSTDGSEIICEQYLNKDKRIRLFHTDNRGLSQARNLGLEKANGAYIAFVDSDDYIERNMMEKLYNMIYQYKAEISVCGFIKRKQENKIHIYNTEQALEKMIDYNDCFAINVWNKLYKRELWDMVKFKPNCIYEDINTTMKLIARAKTIAYTTEQLYHYTQREGSLSKQGYTKQELDRIYNSKELYNFIEQEFPRLKRQFKTYYLFNELAVINKMIKSNREELIFIKNIRKEINKNISTIIFSKFSIRRKIQLIIFAINYKIYKRMYIIGEKNEKR